MGGGNVYDANHDDVEYVRLNGQWKALDVTEAPLDGQQYVRQSGIWVQLDEYIHAIEKGAPEGVATLDEDGKIPLEQIPDDIEAGIPDAPEDGNQYVRQDGDWTALEEMIPASEKGVADGVATLDSDGKIPIEQIPDDIEAGIPDAPQDGKQYARQDGEWTEVVGQVGEAPEDGKLYARQNGTWVEVSLDEIDGGTF